MKAEPKKENRGGARKDAGRKLIGNVPMVQAGARIDPALKERLIAHYGGIRQALEAAGLMFVNEK